MPLEKLATSRTEDVRVSSSSVGPVSMMVVVSREPSANEL
jgi:hypothetical protein